MVTVGGCGPAAPNHHNVSIVSCAALSGMTPRGDLLTPGSGGTNHGDCNQVAVHRHNNNGHRGCHVVSFGHGGLSITNAIVALRCSPGHDTRVTLIRCRSNRGHCVVTPTNLGINSAIATNTGTSVGPNGTLPLDTVPANAFVRGIRLCPNGNTRLTHSTNIVTRLVNGRGGLTVVHLPSNRVQCIPLGYVTAVNRMNGTSRTGIRLNGTNHGHRVN